MPDRVIEAQALISAKDGTGDVFVNIAKKLNAIEKAAGQSEKVQALGKTLNSLSGQMAAFDKMAGAQKTLGAFQERAATAAERVKALDVAIAATEKPTSAMAKSLSVAQAALDKASGAVTRQAEAVRKAEGAIAAMGVPLGKASEVQERLRRDIDATTGAIERQMIADRRAAEVSKSAAVADRERIAAQHRLQEVAHRNGVGHLVTNTVAAYTSAHGGMSALEKALEAGAERQTTIVGMKNAGMGDDEIKRAVDLATSVARVAPNLDVSQILELHKEARSGVQHPEEVFELMPDLARATSVLKGLGADNVNIADLVKGGESLGLMNDPKRFHAYLDAQVRAMKVFGKTITTEQVYEAAKYSKAAGGTLSDEFLNLTMPSLIQEMHGSSAGDALSSLTKTLRGGLQHKHVPVTKLQELGLLDDPSKIRRSKTGEILGYTGKVRGDDLLATDPDRWFLEYFDKAAEAHGYTKLADKTKLLSETLPGTAANLGRIVIQQRASLTQHRQNLRDAPNLERSVELQQHDPRVAMQTFTAALTDLEAAVTGPAMDSISFGLGKVSGYIRDLADAAKAHPNIAVGVGGAAAAGALGISGLATSYVLTGFGLPGAATHLEASALALDAAAAKIGASGVPNSPTSPAKNALNEIERDAPAALPFFAGTGAALAGALAILAGGGAAGAMNAAHTDEYGRDAGTWGGDAPQKDGDKPPVPARPTVTFGTMWDSLANRAGQFLPPPVAPSVPLPPERPTTLSLPAIVPAPFGMATVPAPAYHPADDDRATRARASDSESWQQQQDMMRAASQQFGRLNDQTGVLQASFTTLDTGAGTVSTTLDTFSAALALAALAARAFAAGAGSGGGAGGGGGSGFIQAAYHPGEGLPEDHPLTPLLRGALPRGGSGAPNPYAGGVPGGNFVVPGPEATTAGMRQNNLGNIGFFRGERFAGLIGPSNARDVDHSIARFATQEDGIRAAAALALHKYHSGMLSTGSLIAAKKGGWTPGALGPGASVNIARAMGLSNRDDLHLDDEDRMVKFLRGLALQEHGQRAGSWYTENRIRAALPHEHPVLAGPPLNPRRTPAEHDASHLTTARLEQKLERVAAAVERGGLHRLHVTADKSLKVAKVYSRGSVGATVA